MRIVVDLHFLPELKAGGAADFFTSLMCDVASMAKGHSFVFATNEGAALPQILPSNAVVEAPGRLAESLAGRAWWYRLGLPALCRKLGADLLVSLCNPSITPRGVSLCLFLPDERIHNDAGFRLFRTAIMAATGVIAVSDNTVRYLLSKTGIRPEKISRLPVTIEEPGIPLTWDEKEQVKNSHAGGREYFLFTADAAAAFDGLAMLKAYSSFKKWQHSNMQLVATGNEKWRQQFLKLLEHYKYRDDVYVLTSPASDELEALMGAAYAFLYPAVTDHFPMQMLRAIRAGLPVAGFATPTISAIGGSSILYADSNDFNDLSRHMQSLYKDEALRSRMIEDAQGRLANADGIGMATRCMEFFETLHR